MRKRCCRSEPRCRACPIRLNMELRDVRGLGPGRPRTELPAHLAGLPQCLYKYGPLFAEPPAAPEVARGEATI